jgi:5-methylcytosine-specific restriction endonuclease McrA
MSDLSKLTDVELQKVIDAAAKAYDRGRDELWRRAVDRLSATYGYELPWVPNIWAGTKQGIFSPDFEIVWCFYCGERPGWQRDHNIPKSRGGQNKETNLIRSCATCNNRKRQKTMEQYRCALERFFGAPHIFFGERP